MTNERCAAYYVSGAIFDTHICGETNATASTCSSDNGKVFDFYCFFLKSTQMRLYVPQN